MTVMVSMQYNAKFSYFYLDLVDITNGFCMISRNTKHFFLYKFGQGSFKQY